VTAKKLTPKQAKKSDAGRPTKYEAKYINEAIKFIGNGGKSVTQFAKHIKVSKSTVYLWAQEHTKFSDALKLAQDWSQAVWEDKLEEMMYSKEVNAPLVKLYFANRFRWTDKAIDDADEKESPSLNINFSVSQPKDTIEVTNAKS
jgi:transposase